jgi:hypothetical protein
VQRCPHPREKCQVRVHLRVGPRPRAVRCGHVGGKRAGTHQLTKKSTRKKCYSGADQTRGT